MSALPSLSYYISACPPRDKSATPDTLDPMLSVLAATLANYAPSVQQQTRMSMSRVTGVSQPIEDVVQQLRGGGGSCDVVLVTKLSTAQS